MNERLESFRETKNDFVRFFTERTKNYDSFTEQTNLLIEWFYWTNEFTERSVSEKTNEIDGKWTITWWTDKINLFFEQTNDERTKWKKAERAYLYTHRLQTPIYHIKCRHDIRFVALVTTRSRLSIPKSINQYSAIYTVCPDK